MNVFIQGMRRSGTTIVYDLLSEDRRFTPFYEPLAAARPAPGGGSGLRSEDLFESVRTARQAFVTSHPEIVDATVLNHGAPREWRLEFDSDVPAYIRSYLRFLLDRGDRVLLKFTRMYRKVAVLHELDPDALLLHAVRDPRAVAASYLFGKHHARRTEFRDPADFFGARTPWSAWSSFEFSEHLLSSPAYAHIGTCRDFERILLLWRDTFESTRREGIARFGKRYLLVRNEDLRSDPLRELERIYAATGLEMADRVRRFAPASVRPDAPVFAAGHPAWGEAFDRLGLLPALSAAGYAP